MAAAARPVIVVGGGIAGLICAGDLARAGREVTLFDAAPEVGGRVRTTVRDGFRLDHGFQVLFSAYPTLRSRLDLDALNLRHFRPAATFVSGDGAPSLIGDALADPALLWPTLRARALTLPDKLRLLRLRYQATSMSFDACFAAEFDSLSTRALLQQRGFSASAIAAFFAPFYGGILLDRSLQSSASVLMYTFKMLAEGQTAVPAAGMGAIAEQLAQAIPAGAIRVSHRVAAVTTEGQRVTGVRLDSGEIHAADTVVLATDPPALRDLAQTAGVSLTIPDGALGCATVYLTSSAPLLPGSALWLNPRPDGTVSHAITITNVAPSYAPTGQHLTAATVLGHAAALPEAELVAQVRADLRAMTAPAEPPASELQAVWRVPYSQYPQPPGSVARRLPAQTTVHGLWLASELCHTSSLEGAARGGVAAAQAILATT
jgi:phytoene dehydrogenase-like protein